MVTKSLLHVDGDGYNVGTKTLLGSCLVTDSLSASSPLFESTFNLTSKKHAVVNGSVTGTGAIVLNGTSNQNIGGTSTNWGNITLNNAAGVTCVTDVNTGGLFTFTNGKINTSGSAKLVMSSTASHTGSGATRFVNGPISKSTLSTSSFLFPVGKGSVYQPMEVAPVKLTFPVRFGLLIVVEAIYIIFNK